MRWHNFNKPICTQFDYHSEVPTSGVVAEGQQELIWGGRRKGRGEEARGRIQDRKR
jgi:hypothetical protein